MIELQDRFRAIFGDPEKNAKDSVRSFGKRDESVNLGPIPEVANPQRKLDCEFDLQLFCSQYMPNRFDMKWASFHLMMFETICKSLDMGGQYAYAMPRGSGKTTITEACLIWCMLYGKVKYAVVVGAAMKAAHSILSGMRIEFESNPQFIEDFPEVSYLLNQLTGGHSAKNQHVHVDGQLINYQFNKNRIVLPTVIGAQSSGAVVEGFSVNSTDLRGRRFIRSDGTAIRPDFVMLDDPQSDASAKSLTLSNRIEEAIEKTIKGLAGPSKKLSILMPCTVIRRGDVADRYLNRDIQPEWNGTRTKMLDTFPDNMELWKEYHNIRMQSFKDGTYGVDGTDFYKANREAMDAGAKVTWEDRYTPPNEISAIQHAMNKFLTNPITFASEYQNEPLEEIEDDTDLCITATKLSERLIESNDFIVPINTQMVTAGVDIQGKLIYYILVAWTEDFGGTIVDWGTIPDQKCDYWKTVDPPIPLDTLANFAPNPLIFEGLKRLLSGPLARQMSTETGGKADFKVEKVLIDANYAVTSDAVYSFANASGSLCFASLGRGIPASGLPMHEWAKRQGERKGDGWIIRPNTGMSNRGRHVLVDNNYWKDRVAERLLSPLGSTNCLMFRNAGMDRMGFLLQQLSSERPVATFGRGRWVNQWDTLVHSQENHWWDCLINAAVAASILGLKLHTMSSGDGTAAPPVPERRVVDVSKLKKKQG